MAVPVITTIYILDFWHLLEKLGAAGRTRAVNGGWIKIDTSGGGKCVRDAVRGGGLKRWRWRQMML